MKKLFILLLPLLLLMNGCIRVQDASEINSNNNTDPTSNIESNTAGDTENPSTVNITADDYSFTVNWKKNTKDYGQLEITPDYTIPQGIIAIVSTGEKEVNLNCEYRRDRPNELKEYRCNIEGADKIGSIYISFPYERELLILERDGADTASNIEVLSQFYIFESHGH